MKLTGVNVAVFVLLAIRIVVTFAVLLTVELPTTIPVTSTNVD